MHRPQGYTVIDVIAACLLVFVFVVVVALLFSNPYTTLERQHDIVRQDDVRDMMEAMLELREEQPEVFWTMMDEIGDETVMIGTGTTCGGPATVEECASSMTCFDVAPALVSYLDPLPSDPLVIEYSQTSTGYYLSYQDKVLEIGACSPQQQSAIRLMAFIE